MEPVDILKMARTKLDAPESWGKGRRRFDRPPTTCCIAEAIEESTGLDSGAYDARRMAFRAIYNAAGLDWNKDVLTFWNDAPDRTHGEIIKTLNLAIAISLP